MSKLGIHWIRTHPDDRRDLAHVERMQYPSAKLFEWHWSNRDACRELLAVLPRNAFILARDHPLSEQKQDMFSDPVGTGTRHANEWANKVAGGNVHTPVERTFFLGINEPDATSGDRNAIDIYTATFLERLQVHGLRGGAFNFSTGHPRTVDGTPNTPPDYSVFEQSHQAIVAGHHIGVLHIYGTAAVPCAPGHFDRLKACTWQDVEWVVGECGADEHVVGGGAHDGYLRTMGIGDAYNRWLDDLILGINDPRIHSYQVFTHDFSHPWDSFDIRPNRDFMEAYNWQHSRLTPPTKPDTPPFETHIPTVHSGPSTAVGYVIVRDGANLRSAANTASAILAAIPYGEQVRLLGVSDNGWFRVQAGDVEGWMAAQLIGLTEPPALPTPAPVEQPVNETDNWTRSIAFVREWEGGFANHPSDPGGATNKGITIGTLIRWRIEKGLPVPTVDDLRNLSDSEANEIYYTWYWLASGADKLPWPLALAHFDTAVNAGLGRAEEMLQRSNGDFLAYMGHLIDWYTRINNFETFGRAWIRRRADILLEAAK